jgi:hypothetical protein
MIPFREPQKAEGLRVSIKLTVRKNGGNNTKGGALNGADNFTKPSQKGSLLRQNCAMSTDYVRVIS